MKNLHEWDITPKKAIELQKELATLVELTEFTGPLNYIGGADVSFNFKASTVFAGIVILKFPELELVETKIEIMEVEFPYIPGLLSFREMPPLVKVWEKLNQKPDLLVLDGQGLAHPRRLGLACHAGLWFQVPTIGCAKKKYIGEFEMPKNEKNSISYVIDKGEQIGYVLRTRNNVKPVYISPGHLITMEQSLEYAKKFSGKYRIPEPTRLAHLAVNEARKAYYAEGENS